MIDKIKNLLEDKEKMKHYITYFIFGVLTTLVNYITFWLLRNLLPMVNKNISNMLAIFAAIVFAYFTNRAYVFKSTETNKLKEFSKFLLGRGASFVFETVSFWALTTFTMLNEPGLEEMIVKFICSFFVMIINYVISKVFVFKESV